MQEFGLVEIIPEMSMVPDRPNVLCFPTLNPSGCAVGRDSCSGWGSLGRQSSLFTEWQSHSLSAPTFKHAVISEHQRNQNLTPSAAPVAASLLPRRHSSLAWKRSLCPRVQFLSFRSRDWVSEAHDPPRQTIKSAPPGIPGWRPRQSLVLIFLAPQVFLLFPFSEDAFFTWLRFLRVCLMLK